MGIPIKLVMALVIGVMSMGILMQFVETAGRTVLKDMRVTFDTSGNRLTVNVQKAQSREPLRGATIKVEYPGGTLAQTLNESSNSYTFSVPVDSTAIANVRVTHHGYIPWKGEVALSP
ncbi:hypothetical protein AKJ45_02005 [candidate division MSBL1 archaeon SCGC-AAA261F19]|uniref:Carboxypeptidase regulatory-like domain-containing protein n=2 Tax=candidate division MSBL1 TaxID=215777 RepID=A0A133VA57_9EURY|nr:hypothetical protein AKJ43_01825 [candidate division MSBL1 archaeon SCGC-AAA261D19]KXB03277.1 hypothetical protein AKJ45_02005 [candidate division MSBL1 archaeon SCGC-AAA261F19]